MNDVAIISTCKYRLSEREYVDPLVRLTNASKVYRIYELSKEPKENIIIISGTALKDFDYFFYTRNLKWLKNTNKLVIGICAGAQIIAKIFDSRFINKEIIGVREIEFNNRKYRAFFLITKVPILNDNFEVLSYASNGIPAIFKVRNKKIYGFLFHPEVLNEDLLLNIIKF